MSETQGRARERGTRETAQPKAEGFHAKKARDKAEGFQGSPAKPEMRPCKPKAVASRWGISGLGLFRRGFSGSKAEGR